MEILSGKAALKTHNIIIIKAENCLFSNFTLILSKKEENSQIS